MWDTPIATSAAAVGSAALALGYQLFHFFGLAVFLVPVLLIRYSYWLHVNHTKQVRNVLENTNSELETTLGALAHSRHTLAELVAVVKDGQPQTILSRIVQQATGVKDDLVVEDGRLQGLRQAITEAQSYLHRQY